MCGPFLYYKRDAIRPGFQIIYTNKRTQKIGGVAEPCAHIHIECFIARNMKFPYGRYLVRFNYDVTEKDKQKVFNLLITRGGQVESYVTKYDVQVIANKEIASIVGKYQFVKCMSSC